MVTAQGVVVLVAAGAPSPYRNSAEALFHRLAGGARASAICGLISARRVATLAALNRRLHEQPQPAARRYGAAGVFANSARTCRAGDRHHPGRLPHRDRAPDCARWAARFCWGDAYPGASGAASDECLGAGRPLACGGRQRRVARGVRSGRGALDRACHRAGPESGAVRGRASAGRQAGLCRVATPGARAGGTCPARLQAFRRGAGRAGPHAFS